MSSPLGRSKRGERGGCARRASWHRGDGHARGGPRLPGRFDPEQKATGRPVGGWRERRAVGGWWSTPAVAPVWKGRLGHPHSAPIRTVESRPTSPPRRHWPVAAAFALLLNRQQQGGDLLHCLLCEIEERSACGRFGACHKKEEDLTCYGGIRHRASSLPTQRRR